MSFLLRAGCGLSGGKLLWVLSQESLFLTRASKNADTLRGLGRKKGSGTGCMTVAVSPATRSLSHTLPTCGWEMPPGL